MSAYVYCVTNLLNGKCYVGKTIDPDRRWREHQNRTVVPGGRLLKLAIVKYGIGNFRFEIVQECVDEVEAYSVEERLIIERHALAPNGYNLTSGGRGCLRPSDEVRKKMSMGQQRRFDDPEEHAKLSRTRKGRPKSEATRARMRKPKSPEHREKLRKHLALICEKRKAMCSPTGS